MAFVSACCLLPEPGREMMRWLPAIYIAKRLLPNHLLWLPCDAPTRMISLRDLQQTFSSPGIPTSPHPISQFAPSATCSLQSRSVHYEHTRLNDRGLVGASQKLDGSAHLPGCSWKINRFGLPTIFHRGRMKAMIDDPQPVCAL